MKRGMPLALASAFGAGLLFTGAGAEAREARASFTEQEHDVNAVTLRFEMPFGQSRSDARDDTRLSFGYSQDIYGDRRSINLLSFNLANENAQLESPMAYGFSAGSWIGDHKILTALGAGLLIWGAVEATKDDDDDAPTGPM